MRRLLVSSTIAFILITAYVTSVLSVTGYNYYIPITITNSNETAYSGRIIATINAENLSDNGYIKDSGEDILLTNGTTEQDITAGNLSGTVAKWILDYQNLGANATTNRKIWVGNPSESRNQVWISSATDTMTAADDAILDITTELTVGGSFYISNTPTGSVDLISKDDAYSLQATSASYTFTIWPATSHTNTVYSNAAGDLTEISGSVGGSHYLCVDDPAPLGSAADGTYIRQAASQGVWKTDLYRMTGLTVTCGEISEVRIYYRGWREGSDIGKFQPIWKLNGSIETGTIQSPTPAISKHNYDEVMARPGGGDWQISDFQDLQVGMKMMQGASGDQPIVSQIYVKVTFSSLCVETENVIGAWADVEGAYNGASILLYVDGSLEDSQSYSGAIDTNANDVSFCDIDGYCDDIWIGDTDTETPNAVAEYTFEPDEIGATSIEDVTSNTNTITYSLGANPAGITVTVGKLTPDLVSAYTGVSSTTSAEGIPISMDDEPENFYGDSGDYDGLPGSAFVNDLLDDSDVPRGIFWSLVFLALAIGGAIVIYDKTRDMVGVTIVALAVLVIQAATHMGIGIVDVLLTMIFYLALYVRRETRTGGL